METCWYELEDRILASHTQEAGVAVFHWHTGAVNQQTPVVTPIRVCASEGDAFLARGRHLCTRYDHKIPVKVLSGVYLGHRLKACWRSNADTQLDLFAPDTQHHVQNTEKVEKIKNRSLL